MDIRISGYPDIRRIEKVIRRILVCHLVQYLKLVLILIQTSQLLPGQVLICMLQQVRLPLAGLFHLRVLPQALVNELLLGRHGAHCERRRRRASRQFSGGPQSGNSLLARQRGEPAPKRPPSPPPSMPPTTTNSAGYPYGYPDIRISGYPPDPAHDPPDMPTLLQYGVLLFHHVRRHWGSKRHVRSYAADGHERHRVQLRSTLSGV